MQQSEKPSTISMFVGIALTFLAPPAAAETLVVDFDQMPPDQLTERSSAQSKPGLVPLHELALNSNDAIVRYETESWIKMLNEHSNEEGYTWSKTGRILGYVHDNPAPNTPVPAGSEPVYAFYSGDLQASNGLFYSHLNELVWDGGWWKPAGEDWLWEVEANKIVQANLDAWWNNQDWWKRTFTVKPDAPHVGHAMGEGGVPMAFVAAGIPHWFALLPG